MQAVKNFTLLFFVAFALIGCQDDQEEQLTFEQQLAIDVEIIDKYLAEEGIDAIEDPSGLRYVIKNQGSGSSPNSRNNVVVGYTGTLLSDGREFDSAPDTDPLEFPLNRLIAGWQIGLPKIQEGGRMDLYIPSGLAYGSQGSSSIPPNANLIFDITLIEVK